MNAIETTGVIDDKGRLQLDSPSAAVTRGPIRVIVLFENDSFTEKDWLQAASHNPAFTFLRDPEEDIYSTDDGKPYHTSSQVS